MGLAMKQKRHLYVVKLGKKMEVREEDIMVIGWVLNSDKIQATGSEERPLLKAVEGDCFPCPGECVCKSVDSSGVCF